MLAHFAAELCRRQFIEQSRGANVVFAANKAGRGLQLQCLLVIAGGLCGRLQIQLCGTLVVTAAFQ